MLSSMTLKGCLVLRSSCIMWGSGGGSNYLDLLYKKGQLGAIKLLPYAGSRGRVGPLGSIVCSLTLYFYKRLFPRLELVTSWSQGSNSYRCAKAPLHLLSGDIRIIETLWIIRWPLICNYLDVWDAHQLLLCLYEASLSYWFAKIWRGESACHHLLASFLLGLE